MATTQDLLRFFSPISNLFGGNDQSQSSKVRKALMDTQIKDALEAQVAQERENTYQQGRTEAHQQHEAGVTRAQGTSGNYFRDRGVDPAAYQGDINQAITDAVATTDPYDPNVGSYLGNIGETVFNNRQDAARMKAGRDVNSIFTPDFERSRISDAADDPILADINAGQRGKADEYIDNLFKRGVINDVGKTSAMKNLDEQGSRVKTTLNELGQGSIASGRQSLTDVANRAKSQASSLDLGTSFDPSKYAGESDTVFNDFMSKLGDSIKSKVPGDLYDTSGLAAIAGGAQGGQNFKFDPGALAGIIAPGQDDQGDDMTKKKKQASVF